MHSVNDNMPGANGPTNTNPTGFNAPESWSGNQPQAVTAQGVNASSQFAAPAQQPIPDQTTAGQPLENVEVRDEAEALDEEWIVKAKDVVEQTKHDPFLQSKELNKLRSEYLEVRYSKHVKTQEDS